MILMEGPVRRFTFNEICPSSTLQFSRRIIVFRKNDPRINITRLALARGWGPQFMAHEKGMVWGRVERGVSGLPRSN